MTTAPQPVWLVIEHTMIGPRPALYHGDKPTETRTGNIPRRFSHGPFRVPAEIADWSLALLSYGEVIAADVGEDT